MDNLNMSIKIYRIVIPELQCDDNSNGELSLRFSFSYKQEYITIHRKRGIGTITEYQLTKVVN